MVLFNIFLDSYIERWDIISVNEDVVKGDLLCILGSSNI